MDRSVHGFYMYGQHGRTVPIAGVIVKCFCPGFDYSPAHIRRESQMKFSSPCSVYDGGMNGLDDNVSLPLALKKTNAAHRLLLFFVSMLTLRISLLLCIQKERFSDPYCFFLTYPIPS